MAKENRHSFEPLQLMVIVRPVRVFPKRWTYIEHHEFDSTLSPPCRYSVSSAVQSDVSFLFLYLFPKLNIIIRTDPHRLRMKG